LNENLRDVGKGDGEDVDAEPLYSAGVIGMSISRTGQRSWQNVM
jgi:hypothetical protein